jgi:catechol 2,3-dioxygenase-like lactoylglutathione lyase family enzyme
MSTQPIIRVRDVAFPRLQVPDLDQMESFLMDFGMVRAERRSDVLYMRSAGTAPYVHVTHQGEPAFLGFAFSVGSRADLDSLAASPGFTPVEAIDAPGGGWKTSTVDTVGHVVEAVFGFEPVTPLSDLSPRPLNMGETFQRIGATQRIKSGPSRIKRFGHLAMNVPDPVAALAWYHARFGLIASDRVNLAPGMPVAIFTRCDKGAEPADHHSILFASNMSSGGVSGLNHLSWEVCDIDDVQAGREHLAAKGRSHEWGVGRHLLGSQVFDYWRDPWGHIHEHWTDGDQFDASAPTGDHSIDMGAVSQWGPNMPSSFGRTIPPIPRSKSA